MNNKIEKISFEKLKLDNQNPRLVEFGIKENSAEENVLTVLWDNMAVNEIMYSIVSNGYWDYEPLIAIKQKNDIYTIIEGNRRLAAIKLLNNPTAIERTIPPAILDKITDDVVETIKEIPVIVVNDKSESWQYIGFKHVNGPAKWGSYAKAKYIAEIHNNFGVSIDDIAFQIGDTNNTAQKLYQGVMVLEQAERENVFDLDDIQANRIYFSHLYTGLQREGIREFLNISDVEEEQKEPVPKENLKNLGEILEWLYGSKKNGTQSVIKSQNPDLKYLDEVLKNRAATHALRSGESLNVAYDLSRPSDTIFEELLLDAKRNLQKAKSFVSEGYNGEESLLKVAGTIFNLAESLYDEMDKKNKGNVDDKKYRISE